MKGFLALTAALFLVGFMTSACNYRVRHQSDSIQTELLTLEVAPGEVVMADRPAPVDIESPCMPPVIQGIGRYADVGWVGPRFFLVPGASNEHGYQFEALPSGRSRLRMWFRVPRSEREARALYGTRERGAEKILFCDVSGTLRRLADSGIKRLASWPVASVTAFLDLGGKRRELALDLSPHWASGGDVLASIELENSERETLLQDLKSPLGKQVLFNVSSQWRRTGCLQAIDLSGIDAIETFGLRDGERGAVSLKLLKQAVSRLVSSKTSVSVDGECGSQLVLRPPAAGDAETNASCLRSGESLHCHFEGQLSDEAFTLSTHTTIGEQVAGVF